MSLLFFVPAIHAQSPDSQLFIEGFNAYQKGEYTLTAQKMNQVLKQYPDTPLRDMALFWISRAHFHMGNNREAARYFSQFMTEYPDSPLMGTVEEELPLLARRFARGETIEDTPRVASPAPPPPSPTPPAASAPAPVSAPPVPVPVPVPAPADDRLTRLEAEAKRLADEKRELERVVTEKSEAEKSALQRLAALQSQEQDLSRRLREEEAKREQSLAEKRILEESLQKKIAETETQLQDLSRRLREEEAKREQTLAEKRALEESLKKKIADTETQLQTLSGRLREEEAKREQTLAEKRALEESLQKKIEEARAEGERLARSRSEQDQQAREELAARLKLLETALAAEKRSREALEEEKKRLDSEGAMQLTLARKELETLRQEAEQSRLAAETARSEARAAVEAGKKAEALEREIADLRGRLAAELKEKEQLAARLKEESESRARVEEEKKNLQTAMARATATAAATEFSAQTPQQSPARAESETLREKAIAEYKRIVDTYPGTPAAASAAAKLAELGIPYGASAAASHLPASLTPTARVLAFEVGQYAGVDLTAPDTPVTAPVNAPLLVPFELVNTGNGPDTFDLFADPTRGVTVSFLADTASRTPITTTPPLAPGERFKGLMAVTLPAQGIDGERFTIPVRGVSRFTPDVSRTRGVRLVASAPLLRTVIKPDRSTLSPGKSVVYSVALLNVGSATAESVQFTIVHPPQLTPLRSDGFARGEGNTLTIDAISLKSGESRNLSLTFVLAPNAVAGQELFVQGIFHDRRLDRRDAFTAHAVTVDTVRGVKAAAVSGSVTPLPGQRIVIPITVTNEGNVREDFSIATSLPPSVSYTLYQDLNRDGLKQAAEPVINHVGPLSPFETAHVLIELEAPKGAADNTRLPVAIRFVSDADQQVASTVDIPVTVIRPFVDLAVNGRGGRLKPGEVSTLELTTRNSGSGIAHDVQIETVIPPEIELVASDPPAVPVQGGSYRWVYPELGSGERRTVTITYRIRSGTALGTSLKLQNLLSYQDAVGNRY